MTSVENFELMKLLGMGAMELEVPLRYSMFEEVSKYFSSYPNARQKVLSILAKGNARDALEHIWHFVRLQNEKSETLKSLDPKEFEPEISKELEQGALSLANMKLIEKNMASREQKFNPDEPDNSQSPIVKEAMKYREIRKKFDVVKEINGALSYYGE